MTPTMRLDKTKPAGVSKRLDLGQVTLHYLDYGGRGPCDLVLVHGGGANAHWFDWVGPLFAQHCRVLAPDLRGHGESSAAEPPVYTNDAYIADIHALVAAENLRTPVILGHSMGGMLAVKYTGTWPREVKALIVCDVIAVYTKEFIHRLWEIGRRIGREYATLEDYIAHYRIVPFGVRRSPGEIHEYIARKAARQLPNGRWVHKFDRRLYSQREEIDTLPFWRRITCPALLMRTGDGQRPIEDIQEACPHLESVDIPEAGHHLVIDEPEKTVSLAVEFLSRHGLLRD